MAAENLITLTVKSTGNTFKLSQNDIISLVSVNSGADSKLKYINNNRKVTTVTIDEAISAVKALTPILIDVTLTDTNSTTLTINAYYVHDAVADGTGAIITYDEQGAAWNTFPVQETPTAVANLVNAIYDGSGYMDLTNNQTAAGIKTFSGTIIASGTTDSTSGSTGAIHTAGGLGVTKAVYVGTNAIIAGATDASSSTTGSLKTAGGLGVAKKAFIGTDLHFGGVFISDGTPQTLTGAGAVNITTHSTLVVTTGANALTLADGAEGQYKFIKMKTDGGDGTLTPTNLNGYSTITFNDAGDFVYLYFIDGKWNILTNQGCALA